MKLTDIEEAFARLSMMEFLLEVVMANQLMDVPQGVSDQVKRDLVETMQRAYGPLTGDIETAKRMAAIADRSVEMLEHFLQKLARREAELRARRSPDR